MTKVPIRPSVEALPAYKAGARPGGRLMHKLSSNELPYPPLPGVLAAVGEAAADLNRYPRMLADELADGIGLHHGVEAEQVVVAAGAVAVLGHALTAFVGEGDEVVYGWRSFEAYPILVGAAGAVATPVALAAGGRLDLPAMADAITERTRAVLVCSPNNPTGPAIHRGEFAEFMAQVPDDVLVVADEAYVDFVTDPQAVRADEILADHGNLISVRTFSKAYGLAGLRVGYALGRPRLIQAIRSVTTPFSVSALAEAAAVYSLQMGEALAQRVAGVVETRDFLVAGLTAEGWNIPDPQGNFVWLQLGVDAVPFSDACQRAGLLVRPFPGEGVRVSVGERLAAERLLEVAATWA